VDWLIERDGDVELNLRVLPGAKRNQVDGLYGDALKIRLQAPPVDGKANQALIEFLSDKLGTPRSRISIVSGATTRNKRVRVVGVGAALCREIAG
jgi:uncharacterized protein (TIGR00251 family)